MLKRVLIGIPIVVLLLGGMMVVSFWLVPKDRLNAIIAEQLSEAFGHDVTLMGKASVAFVPYLTVSFGPLMMSAPDGEPLIEIDRASGRLSVTSLWEGNPALRYLELDRAEINLTRRDDGTFNWSTSGLFANPDAGPSLEPTLRFPERLRYIRLNDSAIHFAQSQDEPPLVLSEVNVTVTGPPRYDELTIRGSFFWKDEETTLAVSMANPGRLVTGGRSDAQMEISSNLINASFDGTLDWQKIVSGEGVLNADLTKPKDFVAWLGFDGADMMPEQEISIFGDGTFSAQKLSFRPIAVRMGGGKADGRLEIDLSQDVVDLTGTLAFDTFAVKQRADEAERLNRLIDQFINVGRSKGRLDLRVSAENADINGYRVTDLAAGLVLSDKSFSINVGTAQMDAINMSGDAQLDLSGLVPTGQSNAILRNVTPVHLQDVLGFSQPFNSSMTVSVAINSIGEDAKAMLLEPEIALSLDLSAGNVVGMRIPAVLSERDNVSAAAVNGENFTTTFERCSVKATLQPDKRLNISEIVLKAPTFAMVASGHADLRSGMLRTDGIISPVKQDQVPDHKDPSITISMIGPLANPQISRVGDKQLVQPLSGQ